MRSPPLRVALVSAYPPSRGSLNEYGFHLARALRAHPDVARLDIVADVLDDATSSDDDPSVQRVWRFDAAGSALRIEAALARLAPDAVIFNLQFASFGSARVPAALGLLAPALSRLRRPTVTLLHNLMEAVDLDSAGFGGSALSRFATRSAGRAFTRALLASHRLAVTLPRYVAILERDYGAANAVLVPHGAFAPPTPAPLPATPTVMTFGKFGTYKKIEPLLDAHARLLERDPRVRLVVAGSDSPNRPGYLAAMAERARRLPNVTFTGYVAEEDVPKVFADSTVVAFPYQSTTGSSGVLHQAGQFGRAAVMPRIGDLAELIEAEGYAARTFAAGDAVGLADALWSLLDDPAEARRLGAINARAAADVSMDDVAARYLALLEELVEERWTSPGPKPTAA